MTSQNLKPVHLFETLQQGVFDLIFRDEVRHGGNRLSFGPIPRPFLAESECQGSRRRACRRSDEARVCLLSQSDNHAAAKAHVFDEKAAQSFRETFPIK